MGIAHAERQPLVHKTQERSSLFLVLLTCCSCIGGFLFGYDTGVISGALVSMQSAEGGFALSTFESETVVSAAIVGAILGAGIGSLGNDRAGRKPMILVSSVLFTLGAAGMGLATSLVILVAGRFVVGIAIGISSMTVPVYIAEASRPASRGTLVSLNTLMITGGQFAASIFDGFLSTTPQGWRYMLGLVALPSALQFAGFLFLPESPRWLNQKGYRSEAQEALMLIRGTNDIYDEWELMIAEADEADSREQHLAKDLLEPSVVRALTLGCGLQVLQQFCGINTVMYYGATIIQMAGFDDASTAIWLAAAVAFANFAFTFVGIYLVDRAGRRKTTLWSLAGVVITLTALGVFFHVAEMSSTPVVGSGACSALKNCFDCVASPDCGYCASSSTCLPGSAMTPVQSFVCADWAFQSCPKTTALWSWLIVGAMFAYLACFASGMGCMPWTINAEIYPTHVRSAAIGLSTMANWTANLLVSYSFLTITQLLSPAGAFWLYAGIGAAGFVWLCKALPETKGLPLEAITRSFRHDL
ncbi:proton myo-inositol cotransporter [Achlya hypogyna]|uniref:Hexose transporter 1 n=1 Tax=Achlya hypogyna TaxID=1202772 RepID=A0A1V9ZT27_ACHHY|nr:proton myo-inositol cotransporter [Achlya hypogyna]